MLNILKKKQNIHFINKENSKIQAKLDKNEYYKKCKINTHFIKNYFYLFLKKGI